ATRLGTRPPRRLPRLLVRLALGRYTAALLTSSFPTSSARFRSDFRWQPAYPTFAEGLDEVVAAWKAEGFPPGKGSHPRTVWTPISSPSSSPTWAWSWSTRPRTSRCRFSRRLLTPRSSSRSFSSARWRRSRFSDSIPRSPPPFSRSSWRLRSPTDSRATFSSRGPTRWRSLAPMAGPRCSLRRRSGSASLSSPRSRSGYPSSAAPSEILRDIPRDHGDATEDSHQGHDLRHGTAEPNLATHHEALEILLAFPELGPGVVGPFELEVRGNVGGDLGGRDGAVHDVNQEGGLSIDARQDDFRRDGRGFSGPFGIRVEAIRHLLEKGLSEVLRQRGRPFGTVLDGISLCETGARE